MNSFYSWREYDHDQCYFVAEIRQTYSQRAQYSVVASIDHVLTRSVMLASRPFAVVKRTRKAGNEKK